jgi:hypothetical protein
MRSLKLGLMPAVLAALVLAGVGVSQPPGPPRGGPPPVRLSVEDIVERIMAFDKNGDGKVTRDELPERMHDLITRGDLNKDGALDRDEIRKLATALAAPPGGPGGPGGFGVGGFGFRTDFGPGVPGGVARGPLGPGPGPGLLGPLGPAIGRIEGVVDDLKLAGPKKEQAQAIVKAHQEQVNKVLEQARADMLRKMKEVLSEEEFADFQAALDRPGGDAVINIGPAPVPPPPSGRR